VQLLSSAGENAGDAALAAAEADIDILRFQKYRAALIEKWRDSPGSFNLQENSTRFSDTRGALSADAIGHYELSRISAFFYLLAFENEHPDLLRFHR
jgi:hypothetical protein